MWRLLDLLFPTRDDEEIVRMLTSDGLLKLLTPKLATATRPEAVALLPFHNASVRASVHEAKYHGNRTAFRLLAAVLAEYLLDADRDLSRARLIPVPLSSRF